MEFSQKLEELMQDKGIKQAELAKAIDVTCQAISLWLLGKREPLMSSLIKLAEYFECTVDYLVGRKEF